MKGYLCSIYDSILHNSLDTAPQSLFHLKRYGFEEISSNSIDDSGICMELSSNISVYHDDVLSGERHLEMNERPREVQSKDEDEDQSTIAELRKQLAEAESKASRDSDQLQAAYLKLNQQEMQIMELKLANQTLAKNTETETKLLRKKLYAMEAKIAACEKDHIDSHTFIAQLKNALKSVLTENQLDVILGRKKKPHWTANEISTAFAIRYLSKRCYTYLRDQMHIPLPGLSTLASYAQRIDMSSGLLKDVLRSMQIVGKNYCQYELPSSHLIIFC